MKETETEKPIQLLKEIQANQKSAYETEETEEEL